MIGTLQKAYGRKLENKTETERKPHQMREYVNKGI